MELAPGVSIGEERLDAFCRAHGIRRLGLFGSALRGQLRPDSDIDLLVEFKPNRTPGLLGIAQLELELAELLSRPVDLRTLGDLSRYFRDEVAAKRARCMTPPDDLVRLRHLRDAAEKAIGFSAGKTRESLERKSCSDLG